MFNRLKSLANRPKQTLQSALPRTAASAIAGLTAANTLTASLIQAAAVGSIAIAMDEKKNFSMAYFIMQAAFFVGKKTAYDAVVSYLLTYMSSNLLLTGIPQLKNVETKFLLKPGLAGQIGLFSASLALPIVTACASNALSNSKSNAPRMK